MPSVFHLLLALFIGGTPKRVLWQTVKTQMKCSNNAAFHQCLHGLLTLCILMDSGLMQKASGVRLKIIKKYFILLFEDLFNLCKQCRP